MKKYCKFSVVFLLTGFIFASCSKDEITENPVIPLENKETTEIPVGTVGDNTKVISDEWEKHISEIEDGKITISGEDVEMPKVGEILLKAKATDKFPHGFLGKVLAVHTEGNITVIETGYVSLEEAYRELTIDLSSGYANQQRMKSATGNGDTTIIAAPILLDTTYTLPGEIKVKNKNLDSVEAGVKDFSLGIVVRSGIYIEIKNHKIVVRHEDYWATLTIEETFFAKFKKEQPEEFEHILDSIPIDLLSLTGVPLTVEIKPAVCVELKGEIKLELENTITLTSHTGYDYSKENGVPYFFPSVPTMKIDYDLIGGSLSFAGKMGFGFSLKIALTPTYIPSLNLIDAEAYIKAKGLLALSGELVIEYGNDSGFSVTKDSELSLQLEPTVDIGFKATLAEEWEINPHHKLDIDPIILAGGYLLPHTKDISVATGNSYDEKKVTYNVGSDPILFKGYFGARLYKDSKLYDTKYYSDTAYYTTNTVLSNTGIIPDPKPTITFSGLPEGKYDVVPVFKTLGILLFEMEDTKTSFSVSENSDGGGTSTTDPGVLINGIRWATRNVDAPGTFAATPELTGMYYQWNRKIGWSSSDPMINSNGATTWDSSTPSGTEWEKANDPCPVGWRVPTHDEQVSLLISGSFGITQNGVTGQVFGSGSNTVFLPAAGYRLNSDGTLYLTGTYGLYWSSTQGDSSNAYRLHFVSLNVGWDSGNRRNGFPVRCVKE
jgi:uncharacterized protein (TIGR02145 family)